MKYAFMTRLKIGIFDRICSVMTHPRNVQSMGRRFVHILEESFTKEILIHV